MPSTTTPSSRTSTWPPADHRRTSAGAAVVRRAPELRSTHHYAVADMRFEFESGKDSSTLRAILESDEQYNGERQEGSGQPITYSGQEISFDYGVRSIHPDLLGLLCLIIFYPFIGQRVVFPSPVSPRLEKAFRRGSFKRQFRFDNVDRGVRKYEGSRMALSFGGGIDSSAVRKIPRSLRRTRSSHTEWSSRSFRCPRSRSRPRSGPGPGSDYESTVRLASGRVARVDLRVCHFLTDGDRLPVRNNPHGVEPRGHPSSQRDSLLQPFQSQKMARTNRELLAIGIRRHRNTPLLTRIRRERVPHHGTLT